MASFIDRLKAAYDRLPERVRTVLWSAGRAFVAAFVLAEPQFVTDLINRAPLSTVEALVFATAVAGATAAVRIIQHAVQSWLGQE